MSDVVYRRKEFMIIKKKSNGNCGFVVMNKKKGFSQGHTHVSSCKIGKTLIGIALNKQMPRSEEPRFIDSLIRISNDGDYIRKLKLI